MQIPVLIEPLANSGFRARSGEPLPLSAEGTTRDEALKNLRQLLECQMANGSQWTTLDVGPQEHPFSRFVGTWSPDDPMIKEWLQDIEEYRRVIDKQCGIEIDENGVQR